MKKTILLAVVTLFIHVVDIHAQSVIVRRIPPRRAVVVSRPPVVLTPPRVTVVCAPEALATRPVVVRKLPVVPIRVIRTPRRVVVL